MPTPIYLDGFHHRVTSVNDLAGTDGVGLFDTLTNGAQITIVTGADGRPALQIDTNATATTALKNIPGTDPTISVVSFKMLFKTSLPGADRALFRFNVALGSIGLLWYNAATTKFHVSLGTGKQGVDIGPVVVADQNYLIDLKMDVTATRVITGRVDGGTDGTDSGAETASTVSDWRFGADSNVTAILQFQDFVASNTSGDYPLGDHQVLSILPTADNTTLSSYGVGVMEQGTGTDLSSGNRGWQYLDDWPPTNADAENDADHVTQSVVGSTNLVQVEMADTVESTVWAAVALSALKADAATADAASTTVRDSAGTLLATIYSGDQSEVSAHYRTVLVPGIDTVAELNGLELRIGECTNDAGDPEWPAVMIQYAVPVAAPPATPYDLRFLAGRGHQQNIFPAGI